MRHTTTILKVAAIVSSIALAASFVGFRAGAFDWLIGTADSPDAMSSSKVMILSEPTTSTATPPATETTTVDPIIMSSSKSIAPLIPPKTSSPASKID